MAYDPSNMPPGIEPSPDKMLQVMYCSCSTPWVKSHVLFVKALQSLYVTMVK